jgi:tetratricopeptide (TPR) repeat protein
LKDEWAFAWRGELHRERGNFGVALTDFNESLKINPGNDWVLGRRGETYQQMGILGLALADFAQALELNPSNSFVIERRKVLAGQLELLLQRSKMQNTQEISE